MTISPAVNGFIKGFLIPLLAVVAAYVADPSHLTYFSAGTALLISAFASALESYIREQTDRGLLGVVRVR